MFNLLYSLFRAPWWVFIGLATLAFLGGDFVYQDMKAKKEARVAALEGPPPAVVDLAAFRKKDIPVSDEVHLSGWINFDLNHHLTKTKNGKVREERFVFLMFAAEDGKDAKQVRAALIFTEGQRDAFKEKISDYLTGIDFERPAVTINGFAATQDRFKSQLKEALGDLDMGFAPNFIVIKPFLKGREAALSNNRNPEGVQSLTKNAVLFFLLVAAAKFFLSLKRRKSRDAFASGPIEEASRSAVSTLSPGASGTSTGAYTAPDMRRNPASAMATTTPRAEGLGDDSPLGRMQKRQQAQQVAALARPSPVLKQKLKAGGDTSALWMRFKKSAVFVVTCAILLIWAGNKTRMLDLGDAGDILRWAVTGVVFLCMGFGGWFLMTREDFAGGNPVIRIAIGLGGLFVLGQIQGFFGADLGGSGPASGGIGQVGGALVVVLLTLVPMFLLWAFVIRRFFKVVGEGVDKAAAAAVRAKMKADPFEKLAHDGRGPVETSR